MARARNRLSTPQVHRQIPPNPWLWAYARWGFCRAQRARLVPLREREGATAASTLGPRERPMRCELASSAHERRSRLDGAASFFNGAEVDMKPGRKKGVSACSCYQVKIGGKWVGGHRPSCPYAAAK